MANENEEKDVLQVIEGDDGTVTVTVDAPPEKRGIADEGDVGGVTTDGPADDEGAGHETDEAGDAKLQEDLAKAGTDEERERIRAQRRDEKRRKRDRTRERDRAKDTKIRQLEGVVSELTERVGTVENRGFAADLTRVRDGIGQARSAETEAKAAMTQALTEQNAEAHTAAQELWFEARKRAESLEALQGRLERAAQAETRRGQPAGGNGGRPPSAPQMDPEVRRLGSAWMRKHAWYDANGRNRDSRVTLALDSELVEENYDPATQEYWDELDQRLRTYLPHRFTAVESRGDGNERSPSGGGRPRTTTMGSGSAMTGGGRESFTLSPDRVQALKESGAWDDPVRRDKLIRRYREYDLANPPKKG